MFIYTYIFISVRTEPERAQSPLKVKKEKAEDGTTENEPASTHQDELFGSKTPG